MMWWNDGEEIIFRLPCCARGHLKHFDVYFRIFDSVAFLELVHLHSPQITVGFHSFPLMILEDLLIAIDTHEIISVLGASPALETLRPTIDYTDLFLLAIVFLTRSNRMPIIVIVVVCTAIVSENARICCVALPAGKPVAKCFPHESPLESRRLMPLT